MKNISKVQKIVNLLLQFLIFVLACLFIWHQVFRRTDLPGLLSEFSNQFAAPGFRNGMAMVLLLMVVNWGLEAGKWKYLIGKVERIPFLRSFQAVLAGITVSSFIPNRVGEFLGRIYILRKASRIEGILITLVGSMSQLLITILAGSVALLVALPRFLPGTSLSHGYLYLSLATLILTLDVMLVLAFFKLSFLATLKERILRNRLKRLRKFFRVFTFYHNREMAVVILLSLSRYLVFSTQFFLLLGMFGLQIAYPMAIMLIALTYFIMAVVPTVAFTELGVRGSVALYVFGLWFGTGEAMPETASLAVFAASTLLWIINIGIPALAGTVFVFRLKFFRKTAG
jgi:uncharacterized membrane protein YbhN (UPF0104 family)